MSKKADHFQRLFYVVAIVPDIFRHSESQVLEVADSVHIFNLNCQTNLRPHEESWDQ